ncbi:MAG: hypothetical protein HUU38_07000 [Anaerolineales bacterium]|nr:hypothetical protein [Anaerolineales bacterium]
MKTCTSLNGALALAALAWLSQLWRALIDATAGFYSNATEGSLLVTFTLGYAAFLAGWAYALYAASHGSRGGLMATFALNALFWLGIGVGTLFFYCPGGCSNSAVNLANVLNLILGLLAGVALAGAMGQKRVQATAA